MRDDPFHNCVKASGLVKCQGCVNGIDQWEGYKVCRYSFSPKRCGENYKQDKDLLILQAESVFK